MGFFCLYCGVRVFLNVRGMPFPGRDSSIKYRRVHVSSTYFLILLSGWNQGGSSHHFPHQTSRTWYKENTRAWESHTVLKAKHRHDPS